MSLIRRLKHALQRRPCNLGKSCADLGLFRWWHPIGLDGRHAGLAVAAQQRFAKVGIFDDSGGMLRVRIGLSPVLVPAFPAVFVASLITIRFFRMPAPKRKMVWWDGRFVSSPRLGETIS
jgi:hypothetical protein